MTIQENARFTVFRLTSEYIRNSNSIYLWDLVKMVQTAYKINAITDFELGNLTYNLHLTREEILSE